MCWSDPDTSAHLRRYVRCRAENIHIVYLYRLEIADIDRITVVDSIGLDYGPTDDGFRATATIPLDILDWKPVSGQGVRMDLGYIFGDESGRNALARIYWSNDGFEANIVDDIPDESRLTPEFWGTAVVE